MRITISIFFYCCLFSVALAKQPTEGEHKLVPEMRFFHRALLEAVAQQGRDSERCLTINPITSQDLEALRELGLSTGAYWDALTWLYHRQQNRCMREADERLALAIVRYRQAARRLGVDSRAADVAEELVWGGVAPEAAIHARWMVLPASVRERLEGLGSLQRPFNPAAVMKRLEGEGALPTPHQ